MVRRGRKAPSGARPALQIGIKVVPWYHRGMHGRTHVAWLGALATVDLLACGREHPPGAAELVQALAGRLARLAVAHEVVERVAVVGDLELAVLAPGRAEQRSAYTRAGDRLAARQKRGPERRAGAVT